MRDPVIACAGRTRMLRIQNCDPFKLRNGTQRLKRLLVGGAVVDDYDLDVRIRLRLRGTDRLFQITTVIVAGHDDADFGTAFFLCLHKCQSSIDELNTVT